MHLKVSYSLAYGSLFDINSHLWGINVLKNQYAFRHILHHWVSLLVSFSIINNLCQQYPLFIQQNLNLFFHFISDCYTLLQRSFITWFSKKSFRSLYEDPEAWKRNYSKKGIFSAHIPMGKYCGWLCTFSDLHLTNNIPQDPKIV